MSGSRRHEPVQTAVFSSRTSYSGTYGDLVEVIALARRGAIKPLVTRFPLGEALSAFDELQAGRVRGRAVLIPDHPHSDNA